MLHFAVAGTPHSTPRPGGTVKGIERAAELGITAMEMEWVQAVPKNPERIAEIREVAEKHNVSLTVHAPYYVNLNSAEPEKIVASKERILNALRMAQLAGARSVCVHPAFYGKTTPEEAYTNVLKVSEEIVSAMKKEDLTVNLAFETMGKQSQFGTLEEILKLSKAIGMYPTIDPAHMHARSNGAWNTAEEWHDMFDQYEKMLGKKSLKKVHMHFSGIEYTEKGERKHLPLKDSDARWQEFLGVLKEREIEGTVVCESPLLEEDTILMRDAYAKLK